MKENYWIRGELETDSFNKHHKQQAQSLRDKHQTEAAAAAATTAPSTRSDQAAATDLHWNVSKSDQTKNNNNKSCSQVRSSSTATIGEADIKEQNNNYNITTNNNTNVFTKDNYSNKINNDNKRDFNDEIEATKLKFNTKRFEKSAKLAAEANNNEVCISRSGTAATTKNYNNKQQSKDKHQTQLQQQANKKEENEVNLSFCGCGFLAMYHVGVASCFHEYAPQLSMHKIAGSSAGALVAVSHICGNLQLAYATTDILRVAIDARSRVLGPFHPSFDINATVREALERGLPDDVHLKASGKLHVSLTRVYDGKNVIISEFGSKEDVIQVLICSCYIPIWSGLVAPKYKGVTYIDGGFSNNLLILDDKTVTVSPFAGEADICPQDDTFNLLQINICNTSFSLTPDNLYRFSHALLPPPPEVLNKLCESGFADGIRFLQRMKLISCTKCLEIRSSLLVTTNGEDMEEAFVNEVHNNSSDLMDPTGSSYSTSESHHIRLEQQEQKMIEINGNSRRNSVVSTTSQIYQQQQQFPVLVGDNDESGCPSSSLSPSSSSSLLPSSSTTTTATTLQLTTKSRTTTTTTTTRHFFGGEYDDIDDCDECVLMRQRALCDPLPQQFSDRIRDACDTVNKSLSNWIYSHRPIKYLSYLAAPYYLPIDISLAIVYKCWCGLQPYIRNELANCVYEIAKFIIGLLKRMNSRSTTSTLLMGGLACRWEEEAIEYEKEMAAKSASAAARKHQQLLGSSSNPLDLDTSSSSTLAAGNSNCSKERLSCPAGTLSRSSSTNSLSKRRTSCVSLPGSFATATTGSSCCCGSNACDHDESGEHFSLKITTDGLCVSKLPKDSRSSSQTHLHSLEDTFDSIVDVTSNQEARIFAYYFRDAKNRLQVTEIFDLERAAAAAAATAVPPSSSSLTTTTSTGSNPQLNKQH